MLPDRSGGSIHPPVVRACREVSAVAGPLAAIRAHQSGRSGRWRVGLGGGYPPGGGRSGRRRVVFRDGNQGKRKASCRSQIMRPSRAATSTIVPGATADGADRAGHEDRGDGPGPAPAKPLPSAGAIWAPPRSRRQAPLDARPVRGRVRRQPRRHRPRWRTSPEAHHLDRRRRRARRGGASSSPARWPTSSTAFDVHLDHYDAPGFTYRGRVGDDRHPDRPARDRSRGSSASTTARWPRRKFRRHARRRPAGHRRDLRPAAGRPGVQLPHRRHRRRAVHRDHRAGRRLQAEGPADVLPPPEHPPAQGHAGLGPPGAQRPGERRRRRGRPRHRDRRRRRPGGLASPSTSPATPGGRRGSSTPSPRRSTTRPTTRR